MLTRDLGVGYGNPSSGLTSIWRPPIPASVAAAGREANVGSSEARGPIPEFNLDEHLQSAKAMTVDDGLAVARASVPLIVAEPSADLTLHPAPIGCAHIPRSSRPSVPAHAGVRASCPSQRQPVGILECQRPEFDH